MRQQGVTIKEALDSISTNEFVLPAIQREFVWLPEQVCRLFDSVMQGYPFGEFMLWRVAPENSALYRWYDFVREYHQRDKPHCPQLAPIYNKSLTAVLDGQQRLTAFNIGLRGSIARKLPHKWWNNKDAFPERVLALDLLTPPEPSEDGSCYSFEFIDGDRIGINGTRLWYKVSDILTLDLGPEMQEWILDKNLNKEQQILAFRTLARLYSAIRIDQSVAYYEEKSQDIERVLNIFIRCNSGGTPLSYSNLLLSIAVSQWKNLDARKEVYGLVDELNKVRVGLMFSADFVLKAGLMLTDLASVGFRVENFTYENMTVLEENWPSIRQTLLETAELVDSFGFDSRTLQAINSLLPIAYYIHKKGAPPNFATSDKYVGDRSVIRSWLTRSILKESGIWGSGLDTLLTALRGVIRDSDGNSFPVMEIRKVMAERGKTLVFVEEEIEDLADMQYSDRRVFPLLTMLFPDLGSLDGSDIDHVFPKGLFAPKRLENAKIKTDQIDEWRDRCDRLANLQLLDRTVNNEKRISMPSDWLNVHCLTNQARQVYCDRHLLGDVPGDMTSFLDFYEKRRKRLKERIGQLVNSA